MKVVPIAWTYVNYAAMNPWLTWSNTFPEDSDVLAEFAGRSCYESWSRPNSATRSNSDYLKHILEVQHESVLEHASVTFYIRDVSRSLTHELVRHRHLSYSQRSQRYADESSNMVVVPPDIKRSHRAQHILSALDARAKNAYRELMEVMTTEVGLPRKRARSAARAALLGAQSTAIVVTGNHRAWRYFMTKRNDPAADEEIRELAQEILVHLKELAPATYQDM